VKKNAVASFRYIYSTLFRILVELWKTIPTPVDLVGQFFFKPSIPFTTRECKFCVNTGNRNTRKQKTNELMHPLRSGRVTAKVQTFANPVALAKKKEA